MTLFIRSAYCGAALARGTTSVRLASRGSAPAVQTLCRAYTVGQPYYCHPPRIEPPSQQHPLTTSYANRPTSQRNQECRRTRKVSTTSSNATSMATDQLGWIGLGSMGLNMATNLHTHLQKVGGKPLFYTNRTLSRGVELESLGAIPKQSVAEVVQQSNIIFSCISNDEVLKTTAKAFIDSGDVRGKVLCDSSTVHPDTVTAVSKELTQAGASFVAGPVFGASPMAKAAKLIFCIAGPANARKAIEPYLKDVMGKAVIDLGEDVSKSSMLKINGNILVVSFMQVIAEAHVFAEKTGLGSDVLEHMIGENFGPVLLSYSKRLTTGIYAPPPNDKAGFDVNHSIKDARHALNCAHAVGADAPVAQVALEHMLEAKEFGEKSGRPLDSSSMYGVLRQRAGLDFYTDAIKQRDDL